LKKKIVVINFTLTTDEGEVLDQSDDGSFAYLHGADNIIVGLEKALTGKVAGDSMNVKVFLPMAMVNAMMKWFRL